MKKVVYLFYKLTTFLFYFILYNFLINKQKQNISIELLGKNIILILILNYKEKIKHNLKHKT